MSLRIISGRNGSGKSEKLLEYMKECDGAIYIVPDQMGFAAEKKVVAACSMCGMGNPVVLSFRRLCHFLVERESGDGGRFSAPERAMAVRYVTGMLKDSLSLFGGVARRGEMAKISLSLIDTFKKYNISPEILQSAAARVTSPLLRLKLDDASRIYAAYEDFCAQRGRSSEDDAELLVRTILQSDFFSVREVFIDRFSAFSPDEYNIILALLKKAPRVTVSIEMGNGDEFYATQKTYTRLLSLASENGIEVDKPLIMSGAMKGADKELCFLEENFFAIEKERYMSETKNIMLSCEKTPYAEVESLARAIVRLVRQEGYRYGEIAVIARDLSLYERYLHRVFSRFDIPLFLDKKTSLSQTGVALFVKSALELILGRWNYEAVFTYVKTSFSGISADDADILENYVLAAGVLPSDWKRDDKWDMRTKMFTDLPPSENEEREIEIVNSAREKLIKPLMRLEKSMKGAKGAREKCVALYEFFVDCRLEENVNGMARYMTSIGEHDAAARQKQLYNLVIGVLESLYDALGDSPVSLSDFAQVICEGFDSVEVGIIPTTLDDVCAGSIDRAKGHGAKAVFILGANSGVFPATTTDGGLFSDADIRDLARLGIEFPPDSRERTFAEQLLVYDALSCATHKLYISYSLASSDGSSLRESPIVQTLRTIFPHIAFKDRSVFIDEEELIGSLKSTYEVFAKAYGENSQLPLWRSVLGVYCAHEEYAHRLDALKRAKTYTNSAAALDKPLLEKLYPKTVTSSVTRLERYRKCPFSYFAAYTLNLHDRARGQLMANDSGTFLHDFVDMFCRGVEEDALEWKDVSDEYIAQKSEAVALDALGKVNAHLLDSSPRLRHIFAQLIRIAKRSVTLIRDHIVRGSFAPLGYELVFSENGTFKPLSVELPGGRTLRLTGKIDRADMCECADGKFARIIDYKSGSKDFSLSNVYNGIDLQLCVYIRTLCENSGYKCAGVLYFKLDDPVITTQSPDIADAEIETKLKTTLAMRGLVLDNDEILSAMSGEFLSHVNTADANRFSLLTQRAIALSKRFCSEITNGNTAINPLEGACEYCEFKSFCSYDSCFAGCHSAVLPELSDADVWARLQEEAIDSKGIV